MGWKPVLAKTVAQYEETVHTTIRDVETGDLQVIRSDRKHPYFAQRLEGRQGLVHRVSAAAPPPSSHGHVYKGPIQGGAWIDAQHLRKGDRLINADGTWAEVVSVSIQKQDLTAYNLSVRDYVTFFVAETANDDAVWVHNANCKDLLEQGGAVIKGGSIILGGKKWVPKNKRSNNYVESASATPEEKALANAYHANSPWQLRADPNIQGRPDPQFSVDMSGAKPKSGYTKNGAPRNREAFWNEWKKKPDNGLDQENLQRIAEHKSPIVNDKWIKKFPEHAAFKGDTIEHHHVEQGPYAVPLPETVHRRRPGLSYNH